MLPEKHVAVLVFPFASHPWAAANLVRRLAATAANVHFSFLNTAKSNSILFPPPTKAKLLPNIRVYDVADGLPVSEGEMVKHLLEQGELFLRAAPESFEAAIDAAERDVKKKLSCLMTDALLIFACEMAEKRHIPWVPYWIPAPYALSVHFYIDVISQFHSESGGASDFKHRTLEVIPGLSLIRGGDLDEFTLDEGSSLMSSSIRQMGHVLPRAALVIMNSYKEANPAPLIADLKSKLKIVFPGCLTVSFPLSLRPRSSSSADQTGCLAWLDTQAPQTVAYISFGTVAMAMMSPSEILGLAEALEYTKTSFLWSIQEQLLGHLPRGFVEQTRAFGKLLAWAPQSQVLCHPACGVHVTHCGYNSIFESVAGGVAMICRPLWTDNMMNSRMAEEEWGIGVRVEGGTITKFGMVRALGLALGSEEGKKMREKTVELRERLVESAGPGGSAAADFKTLVELISAS